MDKETLEYIIEKLHTLKIKAIFEDISRGKKRYVSKVSAFDDLIKLLEGYNESN